MRRLTSILRFPFSITKANCSQFLGWRNSFRLMMAKKTFTLNCASSFIKRNMATSSSSQNIIWIDLEMTGLDPESCHILEAASIVTDKDINIIAEGPNLIIHQPREILDSMNDWCKEHHSKSGLIQESLDSKISLSQAEDELLKFVQKYTPPGVCPLAGNSVYMDKLFLMKYMPKFCHHLHYRILDVSTLKILAKSWYNLDPPNKVLRHRALDDIKESIKELLFYRKSICQPTTSSSTN